jgi:PAS domain-containing protein
MSALGTWAHTVVTFGWPVMTRRLQFSLDPLDHRRCRERVTCPATTTPSLPTTTTQDASWPQSGAPYPGIVLRAWLHRLGWSAIKDCRMFGTAMYRVGKLRFYATTKGAYQGPQGRPLGVFGIARDITERERAEAALRESEQRSSSPPARPGWCGQDGRS